jgi:hypothetical protein
VSANEENAPLAAAAAVHLEGKTAMKSKLSAALASVMLMAPFFFGAARADTRVRKLRGFRDRSHHETRRVRHTRPSERIALGVVLP